MVSGLGVVSAAVVSSGAAVSAGAFSAGAGSADVAAGGAAAATAARRRDGGGRERAQRGEHGGCQQISEPGDQSSNIGGRSELDIILSG